MDCQTALEILELAHPDSDDPQDSETASAAAHIDACPRCESSFRGRQTLDRKIARVMNDVSVPPGLRERLLSAVADADVEQTWTDGDAGGTAPSDDAPANSPLTNPDAGSRRRWLQLVSASAACVVAGVVLWPFLFGPTEKMFSVEGLQEIALSHVSNLDPLKEFSESKYFEARLPANWQHRLAITISSTPKRVPLDGAKKNSAALFGFHLAGRRSNGVLLVVPKKWVEESLLGSSFATATEVYVGREYAAVAWREGDLVYVCVVRLGTLESLRRTLHIAPV